jgi:hypothetical protein
MSAQPEQRFLQHRVAFSERQKLLWQSGARHRPQARAGAAGQDNRIKSVVHAFQSVGVEVVFDVRGARASVFIAP